MAVACFYLPFCYKNNIEYISIAVWLLNEKQIPTVQASWETVRKLC